MTCANPQGWTFNVSAKGQDGLDVITVLMTAPTESVPPAFTLSFRTSGADITHVWTSSYSADATRLWPKAWGPTRYSSQLAYETPLAVAINGDNRARLAMATSEAFEKVLFGLVADERTCAVEGQIGRAHV